MEEVAIHVTALPNHVFKSTSMKKLSYTAGLLLLFSACYFDKEEELYPNDFGAIDTSNVTYSGKIAPIISSSCATSGCHPDFASYSNLKVRVDNGNFANRVLVKKDMPPSGPLSANQLAQIQKWLNQGAPNN